MDSSSYSSYTWKKPREEAMGVGVNMGYAWKEAANCLSTSTSSDKLHTSTSHEVQWLSIKILPFIHPYFEGAEPQKKDGCKWLQREKHEWLSSEWMLITNFLGCVFEFPYLKVSFNFLYWGEGGYKMPF